MVRSSLSRSLGGAAFLFSFALLSPAPAYGQRAAGSAQELRPRPPLQKPFRSEVPAGYDAARIQVKFVDELDAGLDATGMVFDRSRRALAAPLALDVLGQIALAGGVWRRNAGADEATLDRLRAAAEGNLGREIADLNSFFFLDVPRGSDPVEWMDALN